MTVGELIKELLRHPTDFEVWAAGCDCWNRVEGVDPKIDSADPFILITVEGGLP